MTKSIVITLLYFFLESFFFPFYAQNSDKKVVISNKDEIYTYELTKNGEVQINAEFIINYRCLKPSAVSFWEYYDDNSEIKNLRIKGVKGVYPKYGMYNQEDIFFSDDKACYFEIPFVKKDSEATVTYGKIYRDIRNFIFLPLAESYYTDSRTIKIITPNEINIDIFSQNLSDNIIVSSVKDEIKKTTTTIVNIKNQPEYIVEKNSPDYMHSQPYIIITPREVSGKNGVVRYFKTVDDLYTWSREPLLLVKNDLPKIKEKAAELTADCITDQDKIRELYKYVQQKIRYLAVTNGILGRKPDEAQNVISKKYGDCKGMSNLLKMLLASQGFDARLVWIATADSERDLDVSNPIPFANHMICALYNNDSLYYLDPTLESLNLGEIPEQLQGQTALIENGDNYIVSKVPAFGSTYNRDSLYIQYSINNNQLTGKASRSFKGDAKSYISYWMKGLSEKEKKYKIEDFLRNGRDGDSISNIQVKGLECFRPEINLLYEVDRKSNLNIFDNQIFINIEETNDYEDDKIDIDKRKTAYKRSHKDYKVRVAELQIPDGYDVIQLPANINIRREKYSYTLSYKKENGKIIYHKVITIYNPVFEKTDFIQWNSDIDTLRKAYGELVVIERKK